MEERVIISQDVNGGRAQMPPGYRFNPTDAELLLYYLKAKVYNLPMPISTIHEHDTVFHTNPTDLPGDPKETRFFFTQRKINNMTKVRRLSSGYGYWKAIVKDQQVLGFGTDKVIGVKKTLVFYESRESKTQWIMDELSLVGSMTAPYLSEKQTVQVGDWVVCRLYQNENNEMEFSFDQDSMPSKSTGSTEISSVNALDDEVVSKVILDDKVVSG